MSDHYYPWGNTMQWKILIVTNIHTAIVVFLKPFPLAIVFSTDKVALAVAFAVAITFAKNKMNMNDNCDTGNGDGGDGSDDDDDDHLHQHHREAEENSCKHHCFGMLSDPRNLLMMEWLLVQCEQRKNLDM